MKKDDPIFLNLQRFANDHKVILEDNGAVGFGRACVWFTKGNCYVDHNPWTSERRPIQLEEFSDDRLYPPEGVPDAYHKHACLCVLVHDENYDEAMRQLNIWINHLESLGELEIETYSTGADGMQAAFTGLVGYAIRVKKTGVASSSKVANGGEDAH